MTDETPIAPVVYLVPHPPSPSCVAILEELLADALAGNIVSLAIATVNTGGEVGCGIVRNGNLFMLMGAVASLQVDLAAHTQKARLDPPSAP